LHRHAASKASYVVVARHEAGELPRRAGSAREHVQFARDGLALDMRRAAFEALPILEDGDWPASPLPLAVTPAGTTSQPCLHE
jgi:hypothetical protein